MNLRIITFCLTVLSNSSSWAYLPIIAPPPPVSVNQVIDYPDDVKDYTNRVQQCYYLKQNPSQTNSNSMKQNYRCEFLPNDSQNMHSLYYTNQKIIDYITNYERNYPFN